jgi:capsular exopolysaccharide synthesis family protein
MNPTPNQSEASLHAVDYWQVIKNRYGIILLTLFLVFLTAAVITHLMPKQYESMAKVEIKPRNLVVDPVEGIMQDKRSVMTPMFFGTEFEKIKSRHSLKRVIEKLELTSRWNMDEEDIINLLKAIVDTRNIRQTDMISITVRYKDAIDARDVTAEVANAYKNYRDELEAKALKMGIEELKKAVQQQQEKVDNDRVIVNNISRDKGLIYYEDKELSARSALNDDLEANFARNQFNELESEKIELESQIQSLLKFDSDQLLVYASGLDLPDNIIKVLYPQFLESKRQLEGLKAGGLGDRHPTIISIKTVMDQMKSQLDEGVTNLRSRLQGNLEMTVDRLKKIEIRKVDTKNDAIDRSIDTADFVEAKKALEVDQALLSQMRLKLITEEVAEKVPYESIIVHDEPVVSKAQASPKVVLNLAIGAVVGLAFGIGIAFFLEYMDTSVKSLEDVERFLQVPVLAVIPKDVGLLYKQQGMSPDAEAYRILRTNIEFNRKNPEDNAITVVSGGAGEGKSTTLSNLAYICAQGGYTTLIIDADLRRPRLHTIFDVDNSVGLSNFLTTDLKLEDVILQTPADNLYFMPSGKLPSDAAGILNSKRMSDLIFDVKQRFDLVLIDSPPILGVSDASVLVSEADLAMIVIQHRKLPKNMLLRVKQAVESVGGNIIGVVLNNVDISSDSQYQYYTSYYTYYSPSDADSHSKDGKNEKRSDSSKVSDQSKDLY